MAEFNNNEMNRVEIARELPYHNHDGVNSPKLSTASTSTSVVGKMYPGSGQVVQAALVTISLDTSEIAEGTTNSTGSYYIEVPTTGQYYVGGQVRWDTISDGAAYWTYIYNGASLIAQTVVYGSASATLTVPAFTVVNLTAGDKLYLKCSQTSGTNDYTVAGSINTFLTVFKIN